MARKGMSADVAMGIYSPDSTNRLKKLRVSKGMSQQDLAEASGIAKRAIQCYEQGERSVDKAQLSSICDLCIGLDVKIDELLESEELREKYNKCK